MGSRPDPLLPRLRASTEKKVIIPELGECWLFTGSISSSGYGNISYNGKVTDVHKAAYMELVGPVTLLVLHKCNMRNCWRPEHLYEGTYSDNARDRISSGRIPNKGSAHYKAILTEEQAIEIRHLYKSTSISMAKLGQRFGVSEWTISDVIKGKTW